MRIAVSSAKEIICTVYFGTQVVSYSTLYIVYRILFLNTFNKYIGHTYSILIQYIWWSYYMLNMSSILYI